MKESWYVVTETRTLDGYKLDNAPQNVEVASDKLNLVEYRNQPYPHLQLVKIDAETKAPIEGVKFEVSDRLGREPGTFSTNKLEQIHFTGMEQGTYYVQEVEAKPGYVLDSTVQEISLLWGKTTKLQFAEVGEGFHSVTSSTVTVTVLGDLPDGYQFTNRADAGGRTEDEWVYAKDAWTTCIFAPPRGCLPKTGFGG